MIDEYIKSNDVSKSEAIDLRASQKEYGFEMCEDEIRPVNHYWVSEKIEGYVRDMNYEEVMSEANKLNWLLKELNDTRLNVLPKVDGVRQKAWVSLFMKELAWRKSTNNN